MAEANLRVGFIGAGGICRNRHLPELKQIEGIDLIAVCNRSVDSGNAVAREFGFATVMTDWRKLVQRDDVDAVFIGTWPSMHCEMSIAALAAGKHVFCQARLCMDWDEAKAMRDMAIRHPNQVSMVCPPPHRMPWEPAICQLLAEEALGEVHTVEAVCLSAANADPQKVTWRERVEFSGLQALAVGIYAETLNAWVGEYDTLFATTATPIERKTDERGQSYDIRIPQVVCVQGRLTNGIVATEHHSGVSQHAQQQHITIRGTNGTLRVSPMRSIEFAKAGEDLQPLEVAPQQQRPWRVERDFVEAVRAAQRGETWSVSPDFTEAARYMRKVQAIHDSAGKGRPITLDEAYPMK